MPGLSKSTSLASATNQKLRFSRSVQEDRAGVVKKPQIDWGIPHLTQKLCLLCEKNASASPASPTNSAVLVHLESDLIGTCESQTTHDIKMVYPELPLTNLHLPEF